MKKKTFISLTVAAALSIGLAGCSQSEDVTDGGQSISKQTITFSSGEETTTTRTSMGGAYTDTSFPFYWESGDAIWVNATDHITGDNTATAAHANFTAPITIADSYKIRYTGTGTYTSSNQRDPTYSFTTNSDANTLVIPLVQTMTEAQLGKTTHFGAAGDCGTATATGSQSPYYFKLDHKAAYLILMPRWTGNDGTYKLKSVTMTTNNNKYPISGRFTFNDDGIGSVIAKTNGSVTLKVITGGNDGITLPTTKGDQTKSINIVIKPVTPISPDKDVPLYFIYEVSDGTKTYYIEKIISGKLFAANSVTPITADIKAGYDAAVGNPAANGGSYLDLITNTNPYSGSCEWDVPDGEQYFVSYEMNNDYNATAFTLNNPPSGSDGASTCPIHPQFQALPTYNQITWYIKGGCYWDADKVWGPGANQKGGVWFKRKAKILQDENISPDEFDNTSSGVVKVNSYTEGRPSDSGNWFFLPAAGGEYHDNGSLEFTGVRGYYWSRTPMNEGTIASHSYGLHFGSDQQIIEIYDFWRADGDFLWSGQ